MSKEIKIPLLKAEDIEVKIKQVTKAGALALIYKTARTDRKYLNMVYGPMNWTSDYKVIKDNLYCGIGVREDSEHDFVWKWDCGIESRSDEDGNEKKGEASDAFKRGGFQWGIGEELYSAPMIWLKVATKQDSNGKWILENKYAKYVVSQIEYDGKERRIIKLVISNAETNVVVFSWEDNSSKKDSSTTNQPKKATTKENTEDKLPLSVLVSSIGQKLKSMKTREGNIDKYNNVLLEVTGDTSFRCNAATEADYDIINAIYNKLVEVGY